MKLAIATIVLLTLSSCSRTRYTEATVNGKDGAPGQNCEVQQLANGAIITCANSTAVVLNGVDGVDGIDGAPAPVTLGIKGYIYPCNNVNSNKEIFLRMTDGKIIAVYDGGNNLSRLAILQPGNYITTDGSTCNININSNLTVTTSPVAATGLVTQ